MESNEIISAVPHRRAIFINSIILLLIVGIMSFIICSIKTNNNETIEVLIAHDTLYLLSPKSIHLQKDDAIVIQNHTLLDKELRSMSKKVSESGCLYIMNISEWETDSDCYRTTGIILRK